VELKPLTDYQQPESIGWMNALAAYRDRVAELRRARFLDNLTEYCGRMTREEAQLWKIPF
jgi:hypothetical protein